MHVTFKVNEKLDVSFDANLQKDIFQGLATLSEVFGISKCGACNKPDIRYVVREASKGTKKYQYHELHCNNCRARLAFGQHDGEKGTLFPKRKDAEGKYLANNGWVKYTPGQKEENE